MNRKVRVHLLPAFSSSAKKSLEEVIEVGDTAEMTAKMLIHHELGSFDQHKLKAESVITKGEWEIEVFEYCL